MGLHKIVNGVYRISLGFVNAFLIDDGSLTLIDTGMAGNAETILAAIRELNHQPGDLERILITHLHTDHTGSLAALKKRTGAQIGMHPAEAALIRQGISGRASIPPPGLLGTLLQPMFGSRIGKSWVEPVEVENEIFDGEDWPDAQGLKAIHTPGHTAGHLVFLYPRHGGVLFLGDTLTRWIGIGGSPIYENIELAKKSLEKLLGLEYQVACSSHGGPLVEHASQQIEGKIRKMIAKKEV